MLILYLLQTNKWNEVKFIQSRPTPCQNTGVGGLSLLQGIFLTQGSNPGLLHCKADALPAEPQGKPKNTGVGSLSLLQWIFPTQESNQGLLQCMLTLYFLKTNKWTQNQKTSFSLPTMGFPGKRENGFNHWSGKIPHASGQLSPCTTIECTYCS